MIFIGDVHGKISEYQKLLKGLPSGVPVVQVGDMGFGFVPIPENFGVCHNFIRGNHDHPALAAAHPDYLGDYGSYPTPSGQLFFVSGAWSIDWMLRAEGRSWWRDEELSPAKLREAVECYRLYKPDIVVTHDGPQSVTETLLRSISVGPPTIHRTRTGQALQEMFEAHQPKVWVFGHFHVSWRRKIGRTQFCCLPELGMATLEELSS